MPVEQGSGGLGAWLGVAGWLAIGFTIRFTGFR
jgi:hypothetical protein